jgi:hypothetical protein
MVLKTYSMKQLFNIIAISAGFLLASCDKQALELTAQSSATVAFIHAAPTPPPQPPSLAPAVDILVDNQLANGSRRLSYGLVSAGGGVGNGGAYMPIAPGSRSIKLSPDSGKVNFINATLQFDAKKAYTVVAYDTLPVSGAQTLRAVQLTDDLTVPTGTNVHVRFLHLAPLAPAVDVTLLRTGSSPDSVTLTNRSYLGATPNAATLSAFTPIPGATAYTLRVKLAGTQTVVFTTSLGANLTSGRIVTLAAIGSARGQALGAMALRHY